MIMDRATNFMGKLLKLIADSYSLVIMEHFLPVPARHPPQLSPDQPSIATVSLAANASTHTLRTEENNFC